MAEVQTTDGALVGPDPAHFLLREERRPGVGRHSGTAVGSVKTVHESQDQDSHRGDQPIGPRAAEGEEGRKITRFAL